MRSLSKAAHPSPFPPGSTQGADSPLPQNPENPFELAAQVRKLLADADALLPQDFRTLDYDQKAFQAPHLTLAEMLRDIPGCSSHVGQVGMFSRWFECYDQLLSIAVSAGRGPEIARGLVHDAMALVTSKLEKLSKQSKNYPRLQVRLAAALHDELRQLLHEWDALKELQSGY